MNSQVGALPIPGHQAEGDVRCSPPAWIKHADTRDDGLHAIDRIRAALIAD